MNMSFYMPVRLITGENCVIENSHELSLLGKKCLIVTGKNSAKISGALDDAITALSNENISFEIFDEVTENPLISVCFKAAKRAREFKADFILGIGGGSPLDSAKAIAVYAANEDMAPLDIYASKYEKNPLPVALIGITSGTGSEITSVSVLTIDETGRKKAVHNDMCYAALSFGDPKYTQSMSKAVTISTALDALCHASEGYLSPAASGCADVFAEKAIKLIWPELVRLYNGAAPDNGMRQSLYYGSLWAGFVLNEIGTAYPHPFGYILTEDYNIPHGRACAAFLPSLVELSLKRTSKAQSLLRFTECDFEEFKKIVSSLADVEHIKMTKEDAAEYCKRWDNLKNFKNVYGGFDTKMSFDFLTELFVENH